MDFFNQVADSVRLALAHYADFSGRTRRRDYWYFCLANSVVNYILVWLGQRVGLFGAISNLYSLAMFVPGLSISWRRMHDIGRKGTRFFIIFVPVVGWILYLIDTFREGQHGSNQYGPDPKASGVEAAWEYDE